MKEELGLVEVAESASFGVHAVARRMPGHTILECQVRMSILTKTEMDTNNKENNSNNKNHNSNDNNFNSSGYCMDIFIFISLGT